MGFNTRRLRHLQFQPNLGRYPAANGGPAVRLKTDHPTRNEDRDNVGHDPDRYSDPAAIGALPRWGYSSGWGYYPTGGLGLVLIIVIILLLMGRIWACPGISGHECRNQVHLDSTRGRTRRPSSNGKSCPIPVTPQSRLSCFKRVGNRRSGYARASVSRMQFVHPSDTSRLRELVKVIATAG